MGGRPARPSSLLLGGDSGPPAQQDTVTRDVLLSLSPLYIVRIIFPLSCPLSVVISGGVDGDCLGNGEGLWCQLRSFQLLVFLLGPSCRPSLVVDVQWGVGGIRSERGVGMWLHLLDIWLGHWRIEFCLAVG